MIFLLILGDKDSLLGKPEKARSLAQNIPGIQIEVVNSGHLISVEQTDFINTRIHHFFQE